MAETIFHVVHSIKGGCGKTAFSLFKALSLAKQTAQKKRIHDKARVLFLDTDFKGTGLDVLIYAKDKDTYLGNINMRLDELEDRKIVDMDNDTKNDFLFRRNYNGNRLNDYLNGKCHEFQEIVTESGVIYRDSGETIEGNDDKIVFNGYLDFIFSSSSVEARGCYSYENEQQPAIAVGQFRIRIERLLQQICDRKLVGGDKQYRDVIIDMPAGYDEYSSILLDVLRKFCHEKKIEIYYYAVTTADRSHFDAMLEDVKEVLIGHQKYGKFNKVYAVFSEINERENKAFETAGCREELTKEVGDCVEIVKCPYQPDYYTYCRSDQKTGFGYKI